MTGQQQYDYEAMWLELGINLDQYKKMREAGGEAFKRVILEQNKRPDGMHYFDDLMRGLHTWRMKELVDFRREGGLTVGIFCVFVPEDLILAVGAEPVALCAGSLFTVASADRILPSNTCALIKSAYGFELEKLCPFSLVADLLIGETTCDGKKKMYELFGEMRDIYIMEVPQRKTPQAMQLWETEVRNLAGVLECISGNEITADNLAWGTARHEAKREAMHRITRTRQAVNPPISGVDALLVNQLSFLDNTQRFTQKANELAEELEEKNRLGAGILEKRLPRILLTGCPMALPNWKVPHLIETSGAIIVAEESCVGTRYFEPRTNIDEDTDLDTRYKAIAQRQLDVHCASFTPNEERINDILRLAEEFQVDGIIQYSLQFCHTFAFEAVKIDNALKNVGIPTLRLETDYGIQDIEQLRLRIQAFLEMIPPVQTG